MGLIFIEGGFKENNFLTLDITITFHHNQEKVCDYNLPENLAYS